MCKKKSNSVEEQSGVKIEMHSQIFLPEANLFHIFECCLLKTVWSTYQNRVKNQ